MIPLVIIGAGGFGRECHDIVVAMNQQRPQWDFLGFIDDVEPDIVVLARRGARWLGGTEVLEGYSGGGRFVVGVGDPRVRRQLSEAASDAGLVPATLVHPAATMGLDVEVGPGCVVCSHVSITTNVRLGAYAHLNLNSTVGHDALLGAFSTVNPGATISGNVILGQSVVVGTNAAVIQGIRISDEAIVGAGAVVTRDVRRKETVVGVPARAREP